MGMDLLGKKGRFGLTWSGWTEILDLAHIYGWEPKGTVKSDIYDQNQKWSGTYFSNNWQLVTKEDAFNIANALRKALKDLKDKKIKTKEDKKTKSLSNWQRKGNIKVINDFIKFCESGSFEIS